MLKNMWDNLYGNISANTVLIVSVVLSVLGFAGTRKLLPGIWAKVSFLFLPFLLAFGVYGGGRTYPYYFLILIGMLILPGLIAAAYVLSKLYGLIRRRAEKLQNTIPLPWRRVLFSLFFSVAIALSSLYAYDNYQYKYFMAVDKSELAQTRFAQIMNQEESPILLNYGFLDGGFYTAAGYIAYYKVFLQTERQCAGDGHRPRIRSLKMEKCSLWLLGAIQEAENMAAAFLDCWITTSVLRLSNKFSSTEILLIACLSCVKSKHAFYKKFKRINIKTRAEYVVLCPEIFYLLAFAAVALI